MEVLFLSFNVTILVTHIMKSLFPLLRLRRYKLLSLYLIFAYLLCASSASFANFKQKRLSFNAAGNELYGTLITPRKAEGPFPTVVFVHGDGPLTYDAYGYYRPIWEALADKGVASFSWDKPGIGGSSGDWLTQNMDNRAQEVAAAIEFLKQYGQPVAQDKIGVIGFSQAGWVLPLLPEKQTQAKFMIFVSTAVNWLEQSQYHTRKRMQKEGSSADEIASAIKQDEALWQKVSQEDASYKEYVNIMKSQNVPKKKRMPEERYTFVKKNWRSDSTPHLKKIESPVLALFGDKDLNVNVEESISIYRREFAKAGNHDVTIKVFPDATHNLTNADYYNKQSPGLFKLLLINILGEKIFTESLLEFLVDWTVEKSK